MIDSNHSKGISVTGVKADKTGSNILFKGPVGLRPVMVASDLQVSVYLI